MRLYLATGERFARLDEEADGWRTTFALEGTAAQCLAVEPTSADTVYLGCRGRGVLRSQDAGESWHDCALPESEVFSLAVSAADHALYAGTEPSRLFRSDDHGSSWRELDALQDLPSRPSWSFPPRPWTSHVRWIAPDPHDAVRLLVGIELGGLMLSEDGGETFADHRPGAQPDVHGVAWHPRVPDRAYEAAGGGAALSRDGGRTWQAADEGRDHHYVWAVLPDPADADRWYVSAAAGPRQAHGGGPARAGLYRRDGDAPWRRLGEPLEAMPYALAAAGGALFAGLADGRVLRSVDAGERWEELPARTEAVLALAAVV